MKPIFVCVCLLVTASLGADSDVGTKAHMGRYRLLRGQIAIHGPLSGTEPAILKIDSATGRTWLLESYRSKSNSLNDFVEVYDYSFGTNADMLTIKALQAEQASRVGAVVSASEADYQQIMEQIAFYENHPNGALVPGRFLSEKEGQRLNPSEIMARKRELTNRLQTNLYYLMISSTNR